MPTSLSFRPTRNPIGHAIGPYSTVTVAVMLG